MKKTADSDFAQLSDAEMATAEGGYLPEKEAFLRSIGRLPAAEPEPTPTFGSSVQLTGQTLTVGAPSTDPAPIFRFPWP